MAEHRIDIASVYRFSGGAGSWHGKVEWRYAGVVRGESRQPLLDAARWLLAEGLASEADRITAYRRGEPAMSGLVGGASKLTVSDPDKGGGVKFIKFAPFAVPREAFAAARDARR